MKAQKVQCMGVGGWVELQKLGIDTELKQKIFVVHLYL